MARNGKGDYKIPLSSWYPPTNGNDATPDDWQNLIEDVAKALSGSLSADGQTPVTGNLNLSGYRLTNLGVAQAKEDALRRSTLMKGADVVASQTLRLPYEGAVFDVSGTATIEGIQSSYAGRQAWLRFADDVSLKNSDTFILPGNTDWTTYADEVWLFIQIDDSTWQCVLKGPLGTATTLDATTSTDDTTIGRALKVGDFGLGNTATVTNINMLSGTCAFGFTDAATGAPDVGGNYDAVGQQWDSGAQKTQIVCISNDSWYVRTDDGNSSGWGAWAGLPTVNTSISSLSGSLPSSRVSGNFDWGRITGEPSFAEKGDVNWSGGTHESGPLDLTTVKTVDVPSGAVMTGLRNTRTSGHGNVYLRYHYLRNY